MLEPLMSTKGHRSLNQNAEQVTKLWRRAPWYLTMFLTAQDDLEYKSASGASHHFAALGTPFRESLILLPALPG
jgi:hypothetical protein